MVICTLISYRLAHGFFADCYPNPYSGQTNIRFSSDTQHSALIEIFDATGKQVFQTSLEAEPGMNEISFSAVEAGYGPGMYIAKITLGEKSQTIKLLELR